nr:hypothetical protein [uncultured Capnocytophaga sp.]
MTILNFDKFVDKTLVKKGSKLFDDKRVTALEEAQEGLWVANVDDKGTHEVEVLLHKNTIREFSCDCTQANGKICGHVVSVFLAIDAQKQAGKALAKPKKLSFDKLLESISHAELMNFVKSYAQKNKIFKVDFELYFAEKNTSVDFEKMFAEVIEKTLKPRTREGYLSNATELAKETKKHIKTAETYIGEGNYRDGLIINKLLLLKLFEISEKIGLSNTLYKYIHNIVENISYIANYERLPLDMKKKVFDFLSTQVKQSGIENNIFANIFFKDYETLAIALQQTDSYLTLLDDKLKKIKFNIDTKLFFLQKKYSLFIQLKDQNAINKLIDGNLLFPEFRELKLQQYLAEKHYEKAKKLLADGINLLRAHGSIRDFTIVKRWELELLSIAEQQNDIEKIRFYAQKYAFADENAPLLYNKWKATYSSEEWKKEIELYVETLEKKVEDEKKRWFKWKKYWEDIPAELGALCLIYTNEGQTDKLWSTLKDTNLAYMSTYFPFLEKENITELFKTLQEMIVTEFNNAYYKDEYKRIVNSIQKVVDYFKDSESATEVKQLVNYLSNKYKDIKSIAPLLEKIDI